MYFFNEILCGAWVDEGWRILCREREGGGEERRGRGGRGATAWEGCCPAVETTAVYFFNEILRRAYVRLGKPC